MPSNPKIYSVQLDTTNLSQSTLSELMVTYGYFARLADIDGQPQKQSSAIAEMEVIEREIFRRTQWSGKNFDQIRSEEWKEGYETGKDPAIVAGINAFKAKSTDMLLDTHLVTKLKEAGFPQEGAGFLRGAGSTIRDLGSALYFPTLSELIKETCKVAGPFTMHCEVLSRLQEHCFVATPEEVSRMEGQQGLYPAEAVARLYIATRKK